MQCFLFTHAWYLSIGTTSMMYLTVQLAHVGMLAFLPLIYQQYHAGSAAILDHHI
jgi:hypothetical protein